MDLQPSNGNKTEPVRSRYVMATPINPTDHPISLEEGTDLGLAIPAERVTPIVGPNMPSEANDVPEHVEAMIQRSPISDTEKKQLQDVISRHLPAFAPTSVPSTRTTLTQHEIDTGDAQPIRQKLRRLPWPSNPLLLMRSKRCWQVMSSSPETAPGLPHRVSS